MAERRAAASESRQRGRGRTAEVVRALTGAELRASRDLTLTGILKWMLEPLSYMAVYFVLVATILNAPRFAYPLFLLCALVPWRFFTGAVNGAMYQLQRYSAVVANLPLPGGALPATLLIVEATEFLIAFVLFVPMIVLFDVDVWPSILWLPLPVLMLFLITIGPTYLAVVFGLYFPDARGVAQNLIRATFFVSTGLYALELVPGNNLRWLVRLNPMSGIFDTFRVAFGLREGGVGPELLDVVYPIAVAIVLLAVAMPLYRWRVRRFPKEV